MPNLNKVLLIGHIVRDHEIRFTPSGTAILNFTIATNTPRKNQDDEVLFIDVAAFGKQAEAIAKYTGKGDPIFIEGRLVLNEWEDSNGNKRSKIKAILSNFQFLGKSSNKEKLNNSSESEDGIPF